MIRRDDIREIASRAMALFFLLSYTLSFFLSQYHEIAHQPDQEETVCYLEDNACHLRLVHFDSENGCEHESHFSGEQPTCDLCPLLQAKVDANDQPWQFLLPQLSSQTNYGALAITEYQNSPSNLTNRGPPINS